MRLIVLSLGLCCIFKIASSVESGDCKWFDNTVGRNILFHNTLEVDPCASDKIQRCLSKESDIQCTTTSQDSKKSTLKILVSEYNSTINAVKVTMLLPLKLEFFIQAHNVVSDVSRASKVVKNSDFDAGTIIGSFEDLNFPECNSYACCNPNHKTRRDIARRCETGSPLSPSALHDNSGFYTLTYLWHPSDNFEGGVVFVGTFLESAATHWDMVKSPPVTVSSGTISSVTESSVVTSDTNTKTKGSVTTVNGKDVENRPPPVETSTNDSISTKETGGSQQGKLVSSAIVTNVLKAVDVIGVVLPV